MSTADIHAKYPKDLKAAVLQERERVLAQGIHANPETAAISEQERREGANYEDHPDWLATLTVSRKLLLEVIRSRRKK
jgi:hypothetical protein